MKKQNSDSHVVEEYVDLAGPYNPAVENHMVWLETVVNDMKRGNIPYQVITKDNGYFVQRTGMILPKSKK